MSWLPKETTGFYFKRLGEPEVQLIRSVSLVTMYAIPLMKIREQMKAIHP